MTPAKAATRLFVKLEDAPAPARLVDCELDPISMDAGRDELNQRITGFEVYEDEVFQRVVAMAHLAQRRVVFGVLYPEGSRFLITGLVRAIESYAKHGRNMHQIWMDSAHSVVPLSK